MLAAAAVLVAGSWEVLCGGNGGGGVQRCGDGGGGVPTLSRVQEALSTEMGETALMLAVRGGHAAVSRRLLLAGARCAGAAA